jgi:hypothetical protein
MSGALPMEHAIPSCSSQPALNSNDRLNVDDSLEAGLNSLNTVEDEESSHVVEQQELESSTVIPHGSNPNAS